MMVVIPNNIANTSITYKLASHFLPGFVLSHIAMATPIALTTMNVKDNASILSTFYNFVSYISKDERRESSKCY